MHFCQSLFFDPLKGLSFRISVANTIKIGTDRMVKIIALFDGPFRAFFNLLKHWMALFAIEYIMAIANNNRQYHLQ